MERKGNKKKTELIVLVAVMGLLVFGVVPVSTAAPVVEVIYEESTSWWNPAGHIRIKIGDKVYDVNKEDLLGGSYIREQNWDDVLNDQRERLKIRVVMTYEQEQQLKEIIEREVGSEYDYDPVNHNCADWVEDKFREIGFDIPDDSPDFPGDTLYQIWESQK